MSNTNFPELGVVPVSRLFPEINKADSENGAMQSIVSTLENPLVKKAGFGKTVVEHNGLCLITGPSLTPHHPSPTLEGETKDSVLWVASLGKKEEISLPWGDSHNQDLSKNIIFWEKVEKWIVEQRLIEPTLCFYLSLGHPHPNHEKYKKIKEVIPKGMQSLQPVHLHQTRPVLKEEIPAEKMNSLDKESPDHEFLLKTFLTTGLWSLEQLTDQIGQQNITPEEFVQNIKIFEEELLVKRPFFPCKNLTEAFAKAVEIQQKVKDDWLVKAILMSDTNQSVALGAMNIFLQQSCVPNMTIVSLSAQDQKRLGVDENVGAAVFPFSLTHPQSIFYDVLLGRE